MFDNSYNEKAEEFDFVKVWQISEYTLDPNREIFEHVQFCHEITYVISGKGTFLSGEARDDLQQGDIHLISKGVSHKIIPQERSNLRFANIGFEFTEDLPEALVPLRELFETNPHLVMRDNGEVRILMTMLLNEMQNEMEMSHQRAEWCIKLILSHIYRMATTGDEKSAHSAKSTTAAKLTPYAIIRYVDTNLFEFPEVGDIAKELGYSQSYISHMFKEAMGITLQEYICNKKIEASLDFLRDQKYTVTQIAMMLNYASVQSFCKAFRKVKGCSPSEYQKRHGW
jgi:AraC-like DNA-binding protein